MSGGTWGYKSEDLRRQGAFVSDLIEFASISERILDWGLAGDTCSECATLQVGRGLAALFESHFGDGGGPFKGGWIQVLQNDEALCGRCNARGMGSHE